ncbi:DUF3397 domain-containing protein [Bacillus solimangrovi]|uniref:DUF3397 domain-containing protein n=1 Tax=Bacillus solimangrovi TaxID=1305675 RepID=A0A1E5LIQ1_9BACI|nr:DUF3397 domain-containing protein [Bacillus solimangrovi]OEH93941.1 hypothetical protein BFG57_10775 [Bacillus solimangrovi]
MLSVFSNVVALFMTAPLLALIIIYWITVKVTQNKKKAFHLSVEIGAVVFIFAVHFLITVIWDVSILWIIGLLLIGLAMLIGLVQFKVRGDLEVKRVRKVMMRLNFLLFFFAYIVLFIYGLFERIMA